MLNYNSILTKLNKILDSYKKARITRFITNSNVNRELKIRYILLNNK